MCVGDRMLQCTGDKAGMQTPGAEPGWAHGAAPFEINGKYIMLLAVIKGKYFDLYERRIKKKINVEFDISCGFLVHHCCVYPYIVSTVPWEHGGLCHQLEPVVLP